MFFPRLLIICCLLIAACSSEPQDIHETRFIMGTLVEFTIAGSEKEAAESAITAAADEMQRIEQIFTIYGDQPNSVKAFNSAAVGVVVILPDEVSGLLKLALEIKQQSQGAFDPALGKLNLLWGFSGGDLPSSPPGQDAIDSAIPPSSCIEQSGSGWIRKDGRCILDFGAIAKGYAIDRGIGILKQQGIRSAIINAGGDIRLIGRHGDRPWRIGIRHPRNKGEVIKSVELEGDVAVVTSGDYERFYMYQGKRYHHIIDPASGWPASGSQSATVIAASAALADAWSTALFVQGENNNTLRNNINMRFLLVDHKGIIHGALDSTGDILTK